MIELYIKEDRLKSFVDIYEKLNEKVCMCGNSHPGYCDNHSFTSMFHYYFEKEMSKRGIPYEYKDKLINTVKEYLGEQMESEGFIKSESGFALKAKIHNIDSVTSTIVKKENISAIDKANVLTKLSLINDRLNLCLEVKIKKKIEEILESI